MDPSPSLPPRNEDRYLRWIALYYLGKGLLFCLLAVGLLGFLHKDIDKIVGSWMSLFGFNMENRHVVRFLARLDRVTDKQLAEWSGVTFAFAGVLFAQGTGLFLRQQWAKYLTVGVTSLLIPVEIFELSRHFGWLKVGVLAANIAVVVFLIVSLVREARRPPRQLLPATAAPPGRPVVSCEPV